MLGIPVMDEGAFNDFLIDVISEGERRTAECMLAEGFEYTPDTPKVNGPSASGNTDSREYAEQVGFGIISGFEAETFDGTATPPPNQEYIASLSAGERDAYAIALFGAVPGEAGPGGEIEDEDFNDGFPSAGTGCKALAIAELGEVFAVMEEFTPQAEEVFEQWDADVRQLDLNETWSQCMADAGYITSDREEARELIWPRLEELFDGEGMFDEDGFVEPQYDTNSIWSEFLSGSTFGPHPPMTPKGQALLDEIGEFERAVAVASFDCREPLRDAERELQLEYEQILVDNIGGEIGARLGDD